MSDDSKKERIKKIKINLLLESYQILDVRNKTILVLDNRDTVFPLRIGHTTCLIGIHSNIVNTISISNDPESFVCSICKIEFDRGLRKKGEFLLKMYNL